MYGNNTNQRREKDAVFLGQTPSFGDERKQRSTIGWTFLRLGASAICGTVFGFALEKGRVFEPMVIRDQMMFHRFVMLKMFLSASATSMFSFSVLAMLPATSQQLSRATHTYIAGFSNKGVLSSALGGAVLGSGMSLSGACPGMVLAQLGSGVEGAAYVFLGGLCGTLLYGIMEPAVVAATKPDVPIRQHYLHQHAGGPFFTLALPLVAVLGMGVFGLELCFPWTSEVAVRGDGVMASLSWPPYVAGMLIGALQIPLVLINNDTLGSSSSFCTLVAQPLHRLCAYLSQYRSGLDNWWQVVYVGGAVMGAYLSSSLSGSLGTTPGVSPAAGFLGGVCMLFGSRMAAGCTSGHGLSGMGLLSILSFVTVPAMFAGGIATAVAINNF